jgi:hypothetical protein
MPLGWPKGQISHTHPDGLFKVFTHCHWDGPKGRFPILNRMACLRVYPLPLGWPKGQISHTHPDGLFKVFTHCHWDGLKSGFPMFIEIDCMRYLPSNLTNLKCICLEIFRHILNCTI